MTALTPGIASAVRLVDVLDARVRIRAVHEREIEHVGQDDVVEIAAATANEARIFLALHRDADRVSLGVFDRLLMLTHRGRRLGGKFVGRLLHRLDDVLIAGATAEIPGRALREFRHRSDRACV